MQDELTQAPPAPPQISNGRTGRRLLVALALLLVILGGVTFAAWQIPSLQVRMARMAGLSKAADPLPAPARPVMAEASASPPTAPVLAAQLPAASTPAAAPVDSRIAELEQRLARLDLQAEEASGNAARAEGLLIAFAARRTLNRGAPLGYLEDQLRLRFADAQPNAIQLLISAASDPVTLDGLYADLQALAPRLAGAPAGETSWGRVKRELSGLFVIRQQSGASVPPDERIAKAKLLLTAGKTAEAVAEIERLPGAREAQPWIAKARRYDAVQRALDLIETTAMLDPHRLNNAAGTKVDQPSPLAGPGV